MLNITDVSKFLTYSNLVEFYISYFYAYKFTQIPKFINSLSDVFDWLLFSDNAF